ncbi:MAG: hypothetical protein H7337_21415 [Rhizobacter sp.]|nr:hypothetical protein [Rhizobacter sp.]
MPFGIIAALSVGALVFLFPRTRGLGEPTYLVNVVTLRQLKQLHAQWELDVMRARVGIGANYDRLAQTEAELSRSLEGFRADLESQGREPAATLQAIAGAAVALKRKALLVEQFKSSNSLLRNSLSFLPIAAEEARQSSRNDPALDSDINGLLLSTLLYSTEPSDDRAVRLAGALKPIEGNASPAGERIAASKMLLVLTRCLT